MIRVLIAERDGTAPIPRCCWLTAGGQGQTNNRQSSNRTCARLHEALSYENKIMSRWEPSKRRGLPKQPSSNRNGLVESSSVIPILHGHEIQPKHRPLSTVLARKLLQISMARKKATRAVCATIPKPCYSWLSMLPASVYVQKAVEALWNKLSAFSRKGRRRRPWRSLGFGTLPGRCRGLLRLRHGWPAPPRPLFRDDHTN